MTDRYFGSRSAFLRALAARKPAFSCEDPYFLVPSADTTRRRVDDIAFSDMPMLAGATAYAKAPVASMAYVNLSTYYMPDYATEMPCNWSVGYSGTGGLYTAVFRAVAEEPPIDSAPPQPPEGMTQAEYDKLTAAEKEIVHEYPWLIPAFRINQTKSAASADSLTTNGDHNGPNDALRHTIWMCNLVRTKGIGYPLALRIGNAHESEAMEFDEVRMDLHNNLIGRQLGLNRTAVGCPQAAWDALQDGVLATAPIPGPALNPVAPNPPSGPTGEMY